MVANTSKNLLIAAHQASTSDMWGQLNKFDVFISDIVIQEASRGNKSQAKNRLDILKDFPVLEIDDEAKELARHYLRVKPYPKNALKYAHLMN
ncbi:MAG: hypothetical protein MRK02_05080 [Candidatus Scalindua sp.]|nr:hypothetical protein [Candidatus Scalindua sp.]